MENIYIESTSDTPAIHFESSGRLIIEGRSMPKKYAEFYNPLIEWAKELNIDSVIMDIKLEYKSSSSSKKLLEMLQTLDDNDNIREHIVNWNYEAEDDDILEKGRIIEELLKKGLFSCKSSAKREIKWTDNFGKIV